MTAETDDGAAIEKIRTLELNLREVADKCESAGSPFAALALRMGADCIRTLLSDRAAREARVIELERQLARANKIVGWMMPYIGTMCPPDNGLFDLNNHCFENRVPEPGDETKGRPINQRRSLSAHAPEDMQENG